MSTSYSDVAIDGSGQYETKRETEVKGESFVARWLAELELASNEEKDWRKEAEEARNIYRAEKEGANRRFNIQFSNVTTECAALYNSTPVPDVRPRYNDQDELSRLASQTIERSLSYSLDSYDFDTTAKAVVQDMRLAGRGIARVRYCPYDYQGRIYEEVCCEHVLWKHFRRGPATCWSDVPWVAFELFLTRDQLMELAPEKGGSVNLDFALTEGEIKADAPPNVFRRARVWEIWDKATRKVIFIAPSYSNAPLRTEDDPLALLGFFPVPEPVYAIRTSDSLVPVCPFRIIKPLADELEEVTLRIQALIRVIKWRGYQHPALPSFERLEEAMDGELLPATEDVLSLVQGGGLDKFVWLMPLDTAINALQQLYVQREQIKQTIFEVSGLSDIMRGSSDPQETLGAQEIKAQFGSMRTQEQQRDVQRLCRDLFRLKAEIICNTFDPSNIQMMTGMKQPSQQEVQMAQAQLQQMQQQAQQQQAQAMQQQGGPQPGGAPGMNGQAPPQGPPQAQPGPPPVDPAQMEQRQKAAKAVPWEAIVEVLRGGVTRAYRIDIETDSTIRGEMRQQQQNAAQFLEGTAAFIQAVGPALETKMMPADVAVDLFTAFARFFRLGKQAEDALSRLGLQAQEAARNPQPQAPSPEEVKAQIEQKKLEGSMQLEREKMGLEREKMSSDVELKKIDREIKLIDLEARKQEFALSGLKSQQMELDLFEQQMGLAGKAAEEERKAETHGIKMQGAEADQHMKREMADQKMAMAANGPPNGKSKGKANGRPKSGTAQPPMPMTGLQQMLAQMTQAIQEMSKTNQMVVQAVTAPKMIKLLRSPDGRAAGAMQQIAMDLPVAGNA